jgi:hypothetical protein
MTSVALYTMSIFPGLDPPYRRSHQSQSIFRSVARGFLHVMFVACRVYVCRIEPTIWRDHYGYHMVNFCSRNNTAFPLALSAKGILL